MRSDLLSQYTRASIHYKRIRGAPCPRLSPGPWRYISEQNRAGPCAPCRGKEKGKQTIGRIHTMGRRRWGVLLKLQCWNISRAEMGGSLVAVRVRGSRECKGPQVASMLGMFQKRKNNSAGEQRAF